MKSSIILDRVTEFAHKEASDYINKVFSPMIFFNTGKMPDLKRVNGEALFLGSGVKFSGSAKAVCLSGWIEEHVEKASIFYTNMVLDECKANSIDRDTLLNFRNFYFRLESLSRLAFGVVCNVSNKLSGENSNVENVFGSRVDSINHRINIIVNNTIESSLNKKIGF